MFAIRLALILLTAIACQATTAFGADEATNQRGFFELQVQKRYAAIYEKSKRALDAAIDALDSRMKLMDFIDPRSSPKEHQALSEFVVAALEDAKKGDVGEAMFAGFLFDVIPPRFVLEAVAGELGHGGRLEGMLDRPESDLARALQQDREYYSVSNLRFAVYCRYLQEAGRRGITGRPGSEVLIRHMFRTDPEEAFATLLVADYGFRAHARGNCYPTRREDAVAVRKLQLASHEFSDYLYRTRYSFPVRPGQREEAQSHVADWSRHDKWWVRLYAAQIMRQHPAFRKPELLQKLAKDENQLVRESAEAALVPSKPKPSPPPMNPSMRKQNK